MWNPDDYLRNMMAQGRPELSFKASSMEEMQGWQLRLRDRFVQLLGGFPDENAALEPVRLESADCVDYIRYRVEIGTYAGLRMPCYLLVPNSADATPRPAVIALHGHGPGGSKSPIGLNPDGTDADNPDYHNNFAIALVRAGYIALVPELLGFGERKLEEDADQDNSCHRISTLLLAMGQTMAGVRVYETLRCIDYLQSLPEVDGHRIGCMGISGGGLVAAYAAAIDQRLRAAVVSGFFNTFEASILSIRHCVDNFVPGLSAVAEMPDLFGLIAPRPLLLESGIRDHIFPIEAVKASYPLLEKMYATAGAPGNLDIDLFDRGHEISGAKAYEWFRRL